MGKILQAIGLQAEPTDGTWSAVGDYSANVTPTPRGLQDLTVRRAMGLPAMYRAVELSAGLAASLTIASFRNGQIIDPQPSLVLQPDPWRELDSWIERLVVNYATEGNNFLRIYRGGAGLATAALEVLDPFQTAVIWRKNNRGRYVKRYVTVTRDGRVELGADEVIHSFGLEVAGLDRGLSPIAWNRLALSGVLNVRDYADRWFAEEAADGVLTTDQRLDAPTRKAYKAAWYEQDEEARTYSGPSVRVMGSGLKYEPMVLKPEDAQWLEAQNFGILDVARVMGMPAPWLEAAVEGTALTYQTLETIHTQFLRTTLFPRYLRKIESALTRALPRGQRARFLTDELQRPDRKALAEIDKTYIDAGVYDAAYVRERDGIRAAAPTPDRRPVPTNNGV